MLFNEPMVLHSERDDGRHWLTTMDYPPLQIWPVARNHCRVGHFLATLIAAKLADQQDVPAELVLTPEDVGSVARFSGRFPDLKDDLGPVTLRLVLQKGPPEEEEEADEDAPEFLTPQPPSDWDGDYDNWIRLIGRRLGVDVPHPDSDGSHEQALEAASQEARRRLPGVRQKFVAGMGDLNLAFKVGLATRAGGKEYVWVSPLDWSAEDKVVCRLDSQPRDCKGYKAGQKLSLGVEDVFDYVIGSEDAGIVEGGITQRIAEDYGLVIH